MNLGVYISTLNEDVLIESVLRPVLEVFPQVEVLDLGSRDRTVEIVSKFDVPLHRIRLTSPRNKEDRNIKGAQWTRIKNEYAAKHDWVFFIDGDEVYDVENLNKMKARFLDREHSRYRVGWKYVREVNGRKQVSDEVFISGAKLYDASMSHFQRAWPREKLHPLEGGLGPKNYEPRRFCDVWCWHGVLLQRSSVREQEARRKKREVRIKQYDTELKWRVVDKWPWRT